MKQLVLKSLKYIPEAFAIEVQESTQFIEDGKVEAEKYSRYVYHPDETPDHDEHPKVVAAIEVFFDDEVKAQYAEVIKAREQEQARKDAEFAALVKASKVNEPAPEDEK